MSRRRGLIGAAQEYAVLYQLNDWTFSGGNLNTGIPLCDTDKDFSVAYDVTTTTNPTSGDGSNYRLLRIIDSSGNSYSLSVYKATSTSSELTFRFMSVTHYIGSTATGRHRFVITHAKYSGSATMTYRKDSGTTETVTINATFVPSSNNLVLGQTSGVNQLPAGALHNLTVYNRVLSSTEINNFLGV